jgi:L-ascorbate metabolism protein UlaG (beta-lactamase superfamily)
MTSSFYYLIPSEVDWMIVLFVSLIVVVSVIIAAYLVIRYYLPLGGSGRTSQEYRSRFRQSVNFIDGKFVNQIPTPMNMDAKTTFGLLAEFMKGRPNGKPKGRVAVKLFDPLNMQDNKLTQVTWLGHSAVLLQVNGLRLLLDPMFGEAPSPFPALGGKRYSKQLPVTIDQLPHIDAVLLSHDHYDHLDYGSIQQLKDKVTKFFVPLGVGAHLERWGVSREKINEHDWWDQTEFAGLTLTAAPARHFSGRSVRDRFATLWCSWIIDAHHTRIFFSGDSGYAAHFAEIGEKYGPFDLTFMECGQYDERWLPVHMMPEETVQAQLDVRGKLMIPIHWGAFTLALHSWTDPIERVIQAAAQHHVAVATPRIGETVTVGTSEYPASAWWREHE